MWSLHFVLRQSKRTTDGIHHVPYVIHCPWKRNINVIHIGPHTKTEEEKKKQPSRVQIDWTSMASFSAAVVFDDAKQQASIGRQHFFSFSSAFRIVSLVRWHKKTQFISTMDHIIVTTERLSSTPRHVYVYKTQTLWTRWLIVSHIIASACSEMCSSQILSMHMYNVVVIGRLYMLTYDDRSHSLPSKWPRIALGCQKILRSPCTTTILLYVVWSE